LIRLDPLEGSFYGQNLTVKPQIFYQCLDTLLSSLTNTTNSLNNYKPKEEVKKQPKQTKKKQFGGNFV